MSFIEKLEPKLIYSKIYNDIYWSKEGGLEEKKYVFVEGNQLLERCMQKDCFTIFEFGFGAGLNFFATKMTWESIPKTKLLHYVSTELHPIPKTILSEILSEFDELNEHKVEFLKQYPEDFYKIHRWEFKTSKVFLTLWIGNAVDALKELYFYADAFYLDGFSPSKNPDMWSREIFSGMKLHANTFSTFSTYSVSKTVKENALANGFEIQTKKGFGTKKEMLVGNLKQDVKPNLLKKYFPIPSLKKNYKDIVILGAGLSGLCLAYSFSLREKNVVVIDENFTLGENASSNPLGYFYPKLTKHPTLASELSLLGTNFTSRRVQIWKEELAQDIGKNLGVYLYLNPKEKEELEFAFQTHNLNANLLEEKEISIFEEVKTCIYFKLGGYFKPFLFLQAMLDYLKTKGNLFLFGKKIQKLTYDKTWKLWDGNGNLVYETELLILANSFGVSDFEHLSFPLQKIRGQICYLPAGVVKENIPFLTEQTYLISEGEMSALGATFNPYDMNPDINLTHNELLLSRLRKVLYNLPNYNPNDLKAKVGFRSNTKDRFPLLGSVPIFEEYRKDYKNFQKGYNTSKYPTGKTYPNLYVLVAMGSKGISYAPILAESLVSLIYEEVPPIPISILEALHPARFIMRDIMKKKEIHV